MDKVMISEYVSDERKSQHFRKDDQTGDCLREAVTEFQELGRIPMQNIIPQCYSYNYKSIRSHHCGLHLWRENYLLLLYRTAFSRKRDEACAISSLFISIL